MSFPEGEVSKIKLKIFSGIAVIFLFGCEGWFDASSMTIEYVTLEKMPFQDSNNQDWDDNSNPDIYFRFEETSVWERSESTIYLGVSESDLPMEWTMDPGFTLTDFRNELVISVYDDDLLSSDLIGSAEFEFDAGDDSDIWTLDLSDDLQISIEVSYTY